MYSFLFEQLYFVIKCIQLDQGPELQCLLKVKEAFS